MPLQYYNRALIVAAFSALDFVERGLAPSKRWRGKYADLITMSIAAGWSSCTTRSSSGT